jgi:hypothetical protein
MKNLKLLLAGILLALSIPSFAQHYGDSAVPATTVQANWGAYGRVVPPNPQDSATWVSYWNVHDFPTYFHTGAYSQASVVYNDTAYVGANGKATIFCKYTSGGSSSLIFHKVFSISATCENDTATVAQSVATAMVIKDSATAGRGAVTVFVARGTVNPSTGATLIKAAAGTLVFFRIVGK